MMPGDQYIPAPGDRDVDRSVAPPLRCRFCIVHTECNSDQITIKDIGGPKRMTVTNDAEAVVCHLVSANLIGPGRPGRRLFYYDSDGDRDEILISDVGTFAGFHVAREENDQ